MIQTYKILHDIDIVDKDKLFTTAQYQATRARGGSRIFGSGVQISWGGSICAVWPIFPEIPHENETI